MWRVYYLLVLSSFISIVIFYGLLFHLLPLSSVKFQLHYALRTPIALVKVMPPGYQLWSERAAIPVLSPKLGSQQNQHHKHSIFDTNLPSYTQTLTRKL